MKLKIKRFLIDLVKPCVELFPGVAGAYRRYRDNLQYNKKFQTTPFGFKLSGYADMQAGSFEAVETDLINRLIPHVEIMVNVGANIGYYCCLALSQGKQVIAFEPVAKNIQYLLRNIKENKWESGIEFYPLALCDKTSGIIEMYGGGTMASLIKGWGGVGAPYKTLVPCSTLDHVLQNRLTGKKSFILVDIEGSEKLMLDGATATLDISPRPVWMVEISVGEHQPKGIKLNPMLLETFCIFWDRGYESWTADAECRQVKLDEVKRIVETGKDTLHTHNFIFIEAGSDWLSNLTVK